MNLLETNQTDTYVASPEPTESSYGEGVRLSMCESKLRYDLRGARTMINAFAKKRGRHGRPEDLRAYPCPFCAGWHLTKSECDSV